MNDTQKWIKLRSYNSKDEFVGINGFESRSFKNTLKGEAHVSSIFTVILLLLLMFSMFRVIYGSNPLTFTTLLEKLSEVPTISTDWLKFVQTNFSDSFITGFKWLGSIFDFFVDILNVSLFASTAITNVIIVLLWLLRWIFLV